MKPTVLILGAGMAGKCAAKLLARRGHHVVLVDRSFEPAAQSGHLHVLLGEGQRLLKECFPEVYETIRTTCPEVNWGSGTYWRTPAGPMPSRELTTTTHLLSRTYLDDLTHADLRTNSSVELIEDTVRGYRLSQDKKRIESVELENQKLTCDICIDSLGRHSRVSKFLKSSFTKSVNTNEMKTSLRYFSMFGRRKRQGRFQQAYFQIDSRKETLGGVISPIENERMIATLISIDSRFQLPENPFRLIEDDVFQEYVDDIEFDDGHSTFGNLHNIRHHFEAYPPLPSNLFLIGDSFCQFNPVFGQGMTVALQSAGLLADFLDTDDGTPSIQFQKQLSRLVKFPWAISTMDPYHPEMNPGLSQRIQRTLLHRVIRKAKGNERIHQSLVNVLHMLESPESLFRLRNLL